MKIIDRNINPREAVKVRNFPAVKGAARRLVQQRLAAKFRTLLAEGKTKREFLSAEVAKDPEFEDALFRIGRWVQAQLGSEEAARYCKAAGLIDLTRAAGEGINGVGGVLVPDEIADVVFALREIRGSFRAAASNLPMTSDVKNAPRRTGGLTAYITGENANFTESSATWDYIGLVVKKITAFAKISAEVSEDSAVDVGAYFLTEVAYAFAAKEDDCGWNGDGTSTYGGIRGVTKLLVDGSHNAGKVAAASGHNTFATIDNTDITNLMGAAPAYALPGARWFVSQFGYATTFCRLAATAGGIINKYVNGVLMPTFLGFPVQPVQVLPQTSATQIGSVMIAFGDLSLAATLGDRRELRLKFLTERFADTDQIGIIGSERVDIVCHDLGDNQTAGPVVGLVGA
jgi:HK97 family phage major capsid protein